MCSASAATVTANMGCFIRGECVPDVLQQLETYPRQASGVSERILWERGKLHRTITAFDGGSNHGGVIAEAAASRKLSAISYKTMQEQTFQVVINDQKSAPAHFMSV